MQETEPKISKDYQIKWPFAISIDKWKGPTLPFFLKLPLKIYLQYTQIKHNGISPPAHGLSIQFNLDISSYLHTVLCPGIIFVIELNLNCFSSCPEYQIKNFSSWNPNDKFKFQICYYKVPLVNRQTEKMKNKMKNALVLFFFHSFH